MLQNLRPGLIDLLEKQRGQVYTSHVDLPFCSHDQPGHYRNVIMFKAAEKTGAGTGFKIGFLLLVCLGAVLANPCDGLERSIGGESGPADTDHQAPAVQLGPRPFFLVEAMEESPLKQTLAACTGMTIEKTDFSIGHRGAPLYYPEHTLESYTAAARMGAGVVECDVTFTKDRELVCRHSQCDLHTTTNILLTPLADKCTTRFTPAEFNSITGDMTRPASAKCCTSDITLQEFKTLCGKMDGFDPGATTREAYVGTTPDSLCGTVLSHAESISLFKDLDVKMTPELKRPAVSMPYQGSYTVEDYAQQLIDEYIAAGVPPEKVKVQSFDLDDVRYWIENAPDFGGQAIYLDGRYNNTGFDHTKPDTWSPNMTDLVDGGVRTVAPPMWMLLKLDKQGKIRPSIYARRARAEGLDIITWTLERSGSLRNGGGWYYRTISSAIDNDGDVYEVLDVLARDVGIKGVFSDWPATVTFYDNCMKR